MTLPAEGGRNRSVVGTRRWQLSIDICHQRQSSAANQPQVAAAIDRRDRQTDVHPIVIYTLNGHYAGSVNKQLTY